MLIICLPLPTSPPAPAPADAAAARTPRPRLHSRSSWLLVAQQTMQLSAVVLALALGSAAAFTPVNRPAPRTSAIKSEAADAPAAPTTSMSSSRSELEDFATKQVGFCRTKSK